MKRESKRKKKQRKIRRIIALVLTIVLTLAAVWFLERLLVPKYVDDIVEGAFVAEYYNEENKNFDVIFIGDCEVYENFSPVVLWQENGINSYIRGSAVLTNRYDEETAQRVTLFQRQTGMSEDGVAWQELQAYLFSDKAPQCTQTLPRVRSRVADGKNRMICGCCMGEGCECCNFTGWVN